ncbi:MAG: hypothetical protein WCH10_06075 [bacterium]
MKRTALICLSFFAAQVFGDVVVPDEYRNAEVDVQKAAIIWMYATQKYSGGLHCYPRNYHCDDLILPVSGTIIAYVGAVADGVNTFSSMHMQTGYNVPVEAGKPVRRCDYLEWIKQVNKECVLFYKCDRNDTACNDHLYKLSIRTKLEDKAAMKAAMQIAQENMQKAIKAIIDEEIVKEKAAMQTEEV